MQIHDKHFHIYLESHTLQDRIATLAQQIEADYAGKPLYLLGVLNGSFRFMADLVRYLNLPIELGFIRLASYQGTQTTGNISQISALPTDIAGKDVIVIEDIVDTGLTLQYLLPEIQKAGTNSCKIAALLFKSVNLRVPLTVDYVGFEIPDAFVVGYGLDYDGLGRELNDIYSL